MPATLTCLPNPLDCPGSENTQTLANIKQAIEVPQQFSENLLDYTRSEYKLDYDDVHTLVLNSQVCFPGEVCLEVGDIGGSCCPF